MLCKQDKTQLESIIVNLDQKKQELIELAVTEVNKVEKEKIQKYLLSV